MSDILGELARVHDAYERPTLSLLHKRHARAIVAIFRCCFDRDLKPVPTDQLHALVGRHVAELAAAGIDVPQGSGRDLCRGWLAEQFLRRVTTEDGEEVYELTAASVDALGVVTSLTRERQMFGEHRINTIINEVRRFNADVNPDRQTRIDILDQEIRARTGERDRLLAGGELAPVTDDALLEGFINLLRLLEGIPGDFQRVREAFGTMRRDIIASFRGEDPAITEVLQGYLDGSRDLMSATPEGRAFAGAIALLVDEALISDLRGNLDALLSLPAGRDILNDTDRTGLRSTLAVITQGVTDVLGERNRLTGTLRQRIASHDAAADKILDTTLRSIETELATWLTTAGPRSRLDVPVLPSRLDVGHLRTRMFDPAEDRPPPPLRRLDDVDPELSLEQLRSQGGPSLPEYRSLLAEAFTATNPPATVGQLFNRLRADLRRPVELFGIVHLAARIGALPEGAATETYLAIRPDGSTRTFDLPVLTLTPDQARQLADLTDLADVTSELADDVSADLDRSPAR